MAVWQPVSQAVEGVDVSIQSYSKHHIDSIIRFENHNNIRVTGFYEHANPNLRSSSWEMLRRVGGDFNTTLNEVEKDSGHRKVRAQMNEFKDIMDDLALIDIKPNRGWFTWVNNRSGGSLIKKRLDRFLTSVSMIEKFPFIATSVVRQTQSNHDAILLDVWGRKPKDYPKDHRLCFRFDDC
ncbi:hypothetical protein V6Z11_D03G082300 [Gossypium hirsutum]